MWIGQSADHMAVCGNVTWIGRNTLYSVCCIVLYILQYMCVCVCVCVCECVVHSTLLQYMYVSCSTLLQYMCVCVYAVVFYYNTCVYAVVLYYSLHVCVL